MAWVTSSIVEMLGESWEVSSRHYSCEKEHRSTSSSARLSPLREAAGPRQLGVVREAIAELSGIHRDSRCRQEEEFEAMLACL